MDNLLAPPARNIGGGNDGRAFWNEVKKLAGMRQPLAIVELKYFSKNVDGGLTMPIDVIVPVNDGEIRREVQALLDPENHIDIMSASFARKEFGLEFDISTAAFVTLPRGPTMSSAVVSGRFSRRADYRYTDAKFHVLDDPGEYEVIIGSETLQGYFDYLSLPPLGTRGSHLSISKHKAFPANSSASFVTAKTSISLKSIGSLISFRTAQSRRNDFNMDSLGAGETTFDNNSIRGLPNPGTENLVSGALAKLGKDYLSELSTKSLIQPFNKELNWSGKGQHVLYAPKEEPPLKTLSHLGASNTAIVEKVLCKRIALAKKTMRCTRTLKISDALREVYHLQNLRHFHIVQLVGTYLQGRNFSVLMYPVADFHLGTFMEDTADMIGTMTDELDNRRRFLASSLTCLLSAIEYIHDNTTKHMDVKPQNILVRRISEPTDTEHTFDQPHPWRVYLADFGLSRSFAAQDNSQTDGPTSRTPKYCAPEVFDYDFRGRSSDIFSLGCVFAEVLTTYDALHPQEFADYRHDGGYDESFHRNLDRVTKWVREILVTSYQLRCQIVLPMLSLDPKDRPTASTLLTDLMRINPLEIPLDFKTYGARESPCCSREPEPYVVYAGIPTDTTVPADGGKEDVPS